MKSCPVCKAKDVGLVEVEQGLHVRKCYQCNGLWLPSNDYLLWKRTFFVGQRSDVIGPNDVGMNRGTIDEAVMDSEKALLCPDCGRFLRRYKIAPAVAFSLERCGSCNGVWLDASEWNSLKQYAIHTRINEFFTAPWQRQVQAGETRRPMEVIYSQHLGEAEYAEARRIRAWLRAHPKQARLMAYLMDNDPYAVNV